MWGYRVTSRTSFRRNSENYADLETDGGYVTAREGRRLWALTLPLQPHFPRIFYGKASLQVPFESLPPATRPLSEW